MTIDVTRAFESTFAVQVRAVCMKSETEPLFRFRNRCRSGVSSLMHRYSKCTRLPFSESVEENPGLDSDTQCTVTGIPVLIKPRYRRVHVYPGTPGTRGVPPAS
eukprot:1652224-Rhodomonas_salina.1